MDEETEARLRALYGSEFNDPIDQIASDESMDESLNTMNRPAPGPARSSTRPPIELDDASFTDILGGDEARAQLARQLAESALNGDSDTFLAGQSEFVPSTSGAFVPEIPESTYATPPIRSMALIDLLAESQVQTFTSLELLHEFQDLQIKGIANDSRKVKPGDLFVCVKGSKVDGHDYVAEAIQRGAVAIVSEREELEGVPSDVPVVFVPTMISETVPEAPSPEEKEDPAKKTEPPPKMVPHQHLSRLASTFYNHPSKRMRVIGVTGTNGKTTTSWLIRGILEEQDRLTGLIGTVEYALAEDLLTETGDLWYRTEEDPTLNRDCTHPFAIAPYKGKYRVPSTTPDALQIQQVLAGMADREAKDCVMECSSIGLDQGRCDFVDFDVAVFTNLTRDHLDYHKTEEAYKKAKLKLFRGLKDPSRQRAVVNMDDPAGEEFRQAASSVPVITYAVQDRDVDVFAERISTSIWETEIVVRTPVGRLKIITPLLGKMNVSNVLAAVCVGLTLGVPLLQIVKGIEGVDVVPGRCEIIDEGQPFPVLVDYAHTPDALSRLLDTVREAGARRIILVMGCGGDRDKGKRPYMGEIAHYKADIVVVTNDNPRTEDPAAIIQDIVAGFPEKVVNKHPWNTYDWLQDPIRVPKWYQNIVLWCQQDVRRYIIEDRFMAIRSAMFMAGPKDVVVIAGKGHEDYQVFGGPMREDGQQDLLYGWFDDRVEARNALSKLVFLDGIKSLSRAQGTLIPAGRRSEDPFSELD